MKHKWMRVHLLKKGATERKGERNLEKIVTRHKLCKVHAARSSWINRATKLDKIRKEKRKEKQQAVTKCKATHKKGEVGNPRMMSDSVLIPS